ncbi:hypothetical protein FI667_g9256, partial [Globisporangium splendens]
MALAACWNIKSREDPSVRFAQKINGSATSTLRPFVFCSNMSATSMYSIGFGKRIKGDEITSRSVQTRLGATTIVSLKNAHKLYSITVGLLSWETRDLADWYGAKCLRSDDTMRRGLSYKLQSTNPEQHLLVGSRRLSAHSLEPRDDYAEQVTDYMISLATTADIHSQNDKIKREVILPRNFDNVSWPSPSDVDSENCSMDAEDFVHRTVLNHLYIEKTLQPVYTAAFFYLFQDAAVHGVLNNSANSSLGSSVTLAFVNNIRLIDIKLSSPLSNAISTLCTACILFGIAIAIVISDNQGKTKLQQALDAHSVTEALINERKFPLLLFKSTIDVREGAKITANFLKMTMRSLQRTRLWTGFALSVEC